MTQTKLTRMFLIMLFAALMLSTGVSAHFDHHHHGDIDLHHDCLSCLFLVSMAVTAAVITIQRARRLTSVTVVIRAPRIPLSWTVTQPADHHVESFPDPIYSRPPPA